MNIFEGLDISPSKILGFNPMWIVGGIVIFIVIIAFSSSLKIAKKRRSKYIYTPTNTEKNFYRQYSKQYRKSFDYRPKTSFKKPRVRKFK